jgi:hypothetical protein
MQMKKQQMGLSMIGWMALLSMIGILGLCALKMAPAYMEYYTLKSILNNMKTEASLKGQGQAIIQDSFLKRLYISDVDSVVKGTYKIKKIKGKAGYIIDVNYEVRKSVFGNLSLVAAFEYSSEVGG